MALKLFTLFLLIWSVLGSDYTGKTLQGNILLPDAFSGIAKGSCMSIELQDGRIADGRSKTLSKKVLKDAELKFEKGKPMLYNLDLKGQLEDDAKYSVAVVLNNKWCAKEGGQEWTRKGDLLTVQDFPVKLKDCSKQETKECKGPMVSLTQT